MPKNFHPMSGHIALQAWQPFLRERGHGEVEARIDLLKSLCDPASAQEINCYMARVLCHPPLEFRKDVQIDYRSVAERTRSSWARKAVAASPRIDAHALRSEYDLAGVDIDDKFFRPESFLYHCGLAFIDDVEAIVRGRAVIDGGAYRGESAVVLRRRLPASQVHAFEPDANNFAVLSSVAKTTRYGSGIVPVQSGLGAKACLAASRIGGHGTRLAPAQEERATISITSIDAYAASTGIDVGFFKLDIEGMEYDAIAGAVETLKRDRPAFSVAIYHGPRDFLDIAPVIASLNLDYDLMIRHLHPQLTSFFGEFMLIGRPR